MCELDAENGWEMDEGREKVTDEMKAALPVLDKGVGGKCWTKVQSVR